jgi:hypothetical protein
LRLTPSEFRALTITEFNAMVEARVEHDRARDAQWRVFFASMTANMMNASGHVQTAVQPEDLLGADDRLAILRAQAQALAEQKLRGQRKG